MDNSANSNVWKNKTDLVGPMKPTNPNEGVTTIGKNGLSPKGIGEIEITWVDYGSYTRTFFSVTAFAEQL